MRLMIWLKQLSCRHEWKTIGEVTRFTDRFDGVLTECLSEIRECEKCHKRETHFMRFPHDA